MSALLLIVKLPDCTIPVELPTGSGVTALAPAVSGNRSLRTLVRIGLSSDAVWYSAMVRADYKKYQQMFGAAMNISEFHDVFFRRVEGAKLEVPKAVEAAFDDRRTEDERAIKALIDRYSAQQATGFEQELFKQRKRLADDERTLQTKVTKKALRAAINSERTCE